MAMFDNGTAQPNLSAKNVQKFVIRPTSLGDQKQVVQQISRSMQLCVEFEIELGDKSDLAGRFVKSLSASFLS